MNIQNAKSAVINELFFTVMKQKRISFESLLLMCASPMDFDHYLSKYNDLKVYKNFTPELNSLLLDNYNRIDFSVLKNRHYKFLTDFFLTNEVKCLVDKDFCLLYVECMSLNRFKYDILFETYPFLLNDSVQKVDKDNRYFYYHFWINVLQNQELSITEINKFYKIFISNKEYAQLLTSSKNQFWQCNPILIKTVIKVRES